MSTLATLFALSAPFVSADPVSRAAALALVHFLWQGAAVAVLLWLANRMLRGASARARYTVACAALAVMCALPSATFRSLRARAASASVSVSPRAALSPAPPPSAPAPATAARRDPLSAAAPWILMGWLAGVCALSVRFLGGCLAARSLTRRRTRPADPAWEERLLRLAQRLGIRRAIRARIRLLESAAVRVPTVVGLLRPVVLIPAGIATGMSVFQLESLLAHELAHIRRGDALVNFLQAVAETLLFYHPAVWWASSCIRIERENACDDLAVEATGDAMAYARALLDLAERRRGAPTLAVAADGGSLRSRIARLVAPPERGGPADDASGHGYGYGYGYGLLRWLAGALALGAVLILGAAARIPTPEARPSPPAATAQQPERTQAQAQAPARPPVESPASAPAPAPAPPDPAPAPRNASAPVLLSPEELISFRIHDVTPEFIGELVALGYTRATPEELVALRIHGVTPEYIRAMTAIFGKLPLQSYVDFRIHGLTPDSLRQLEAIFGKGTLSPDDALSMRIHGVDAAYVAGFRDAGFPSISAEEAVSLRIHGATPEFARAMRAQGFAELSLDDLVAFRIHGATPEYVAAIRSLGYSPLTPDDVTAFRIHGLTPESIRAMNERAGERLSPDELVDWSIHAPSRSRSRSQASPKEKLP